MNTINPFNITKAVDYSDEEINEFWVDIPGDSGFTDIIKPTSPMPMIILGGKGSGKTHIMRYFSYNLQKLRHNTQGLETVKSDGYVGVYMRCSGLNSNRFSGKNQSQDLWNSVFSYYMELWLAQLLLTTIVELFGQNEEESNDEKLYHAINELFDEINAKVDEEKNLNSIINRLKQLQKEVDYEVNNCAITGQPITSIRISVTSGKLVFGIPQLLSKLIPELSEIKFIYLLDEYENLTSNQQMYVNTLIREKEDPATFRIGSRLYGMKTYLTFSAQEEIKVGSEYESYNIDGFFRDREDDYKQFVINICLKRLNTNGFSVTSQSELESYFRVPSFEENIQHKISNKVYFNRLTRKLQQAKIKDVDTIISNLTFEQSVLLERTNVFLFYRIWKKGKAKLLDSAAEIHKECILYFENREGKNLTQHHKVLDKYKNDIIDQVYRELSLPVVYLGLPTYIKMSCGIPRHLLIILKHIYRWSVFNGENPFVNGNMLSTNSQMRGLNEATSWFLNDARIPGREGKDVQLSIHRLGTLLQALRFSDLPPECSISSFAIKTSVAHEKINAIIDYMKRYSYLIEVNSRRDKNSNRKDTTYQINGLLAPEWELSINRRGIVSFSEIEMKAIFEPNDESEFKSFLNTKAGSYNAPFYQQPTLFE